MNKIKTHILCLISFLIIFPISAFGSGNYLGPRMEMGVGIDGSRMQSRPDWAGKYYAAGNINFALRLYRGLAFQASRNFAYGTDPYPTGINYGTDKILNTSGGTLSSSSRLGLRYEQDLSKKKILPFNADIAYVSAGIINSTFSVRSTQWIENSELVKSNGKTVYQFADASGYYAEAAIRIKLKTDYSDEKDSWFGSYGLDFGARYSRYSDCNTRFPNIKESANNFNSYQIFINLFMKFRLFY